MGYYTNYTLEIENKDDFEPDLERKVVENLIEISAEWDISDFETIKRLSRPLEFVSYDLMKWYDWEDDMIELSKRFPKCKFVLSGNGEDSEDLWRTYFYNGHVQYARAHIFYPAPLWDELYDMDNPEG